MNYNYFAFVQGGLGPDVWDRELQITAVDFQHASSIALAEAEELGGHVVSLEQNDWRKGLPPLPPTVLTAEQLFFKHVISTYNGMQAFIDEINARDSAIEAQGVVKGMERAVEVVQKACELCSGAGFTIVSRSEHGCDGTEQICHLVCPVEVQVREQCEYCGRPIATLTAEIKQLKKA